jgi:hypothetical protein
MSHNHQDPGTPAGVPRPVLFLDVDGPLNPYAAKPTRRPPGYVTHRMRPASWIASQPHGRPRPTRYTRPLRVWLNPAHGPALLALPAELVWATTWQHEANEWIAPAIGLPELPVVEWPPQSDHKQSPDGLFWKTRPLIDYAAGRPFAWVDDQLTAADWRWCAEHHPAPTLLLPIDPARGLTDGDVAALTRWTYLHASDAASSHSTDSLGSDEHAP